MLCDCCVYRGIRKDGAHLWCYGKGKFTVVQDNCITFKNKKRMSNLTFEGKIIAIGKQRSGTSANGPWVIQEYTIQEDTSNYPMAMTFEVSGEDRIRMFNIKEGEKLTVHYNLDAHEYQGRWYNSIKVWRVERTAEAQPEQKPAEAPVEFPKTDEPPF